MGPAKKFKERAFQGLQVLPGMPASSMLASRSTQAYLVAEIHSPTSGLRKCMVLRVELKGIVRAGRYQQMPALEIRELLDLEMAIMVRLCAVRYLLALCS